MVLDQNTLAEIRRTALTENSLFFKNFSNAVIEEIIPCLNKCMFSRDSIIFSKGDYADSLYLIADGQVEISVSSSNGKTIVLAIMSHGDVFGEIGVLDKCERSAGAHAKSDVTLYKLSQHDFTQMTKKFTPQEWSAITRYLCTLFRRVEHNLEEMALIDTDLRLLRKIFEIYERDVITPSSDPVFKINLSQQSLGSMLGLSREATNRILSRLNKTGLITSKYNHILIHNIDKLKQLIQKSDTEE